MEGPRPESISGAQDIASFVQIALERMSHARVLEVRRVEVNIGCFALRALDRAIVTRLRTSCSLKCLPVPLPHVKSSAKLDSLPHLKPPVEKVG